jgi:hypothetical protein
MNPTDDAVPLNPATYLTENDPALRNAWQYYNAFDAASNRQKAETLQTRRIIILLGFLTASFAAISTLDKSPRLLGTLLIFGILALLIHPEEFGLKRLYPKTLTPQQIMGARVGIVLFFTLVIVTLHSLDLLDELFVVFLLVLPIGVAAAMSYTAGMLPNVLWVVSRVTAETIRREIYLYRTEAGDYSEKSIQQWLQELKTNVGTPDKLSPFLREIVRFANRSEPEFKTLLRQRKLNWEVRRAKERINKLDNVEPYLQAIEHDKDHIGQLPRAPQAHTDRPDEDLGYLPMTFSQYVAYRVEPQTEWYLNRSRTDINRYKRLRLFSIGITSAGALLGALGAVAKGYEGLVVITTAGGIALATYMQLKMYGQTYTLYHRTADKLNEEKVDWQLHSSAELEQPEMKAAFITKIENIFHEERTYWIQRALQSQISAEMALVGNVDDWVRSQFDLVIQNEADVKRLFDEEG